MGLSQSTGRQSRHPLRCTAPQESFPVPAGTDDQERPDPTERIRPQAGPPARSPRTSGPLVATTPRPPLPSPPPLPPPPPPPAPPATPLPCGGFVFLFPLFRPAPRGR